jgi:AcrR family transcriptional regulator
LSQSSPEEGRQRVRFANVRAPKPVLGRETMERLTPRQLQVFEELEQLVQNEKISDLTMSQIASKLGCSLRTLYDISPSKDELVLAAADRNLRRVGKAAIDALDPSMPPLTMLRAYLRAANNADEPTQTIYARELASIPASKRMIDVHEDYVMAVTKSMLDRAVELGDIPAVDTASVAHVLGGLLREFARSDVREVIEHSPKKAANEVTEIILHGLTQKK